MADRDINEIITEKINLGIMQTQVKPPINTIIFTEKLGKSVETSEGKLHILSSIDLRIKSGESIAIIGESGSGKSTLISLLAGLDKIGRAHV
jgi:putative ABC transport system ATP-binding protein